jgi:hypothetical protein
LSFSDVVTVGLPAALVIRLTTAVVTFALARRPQACRLVALGGSILASAVTMAVAVHVIASGHVLEGVLARHVASGIVLGYSVTPLSAWFLMVLGLVAVPVSAVFRDGQRDAVWVVTIGKARKRLVRLGAQGVSRAEVVEGLKTGERIVVRGADRVRDGQQVS